MIILFAEIAFHFGEKLQDQLKEDIVKREITEQKLQQYTERLRLIHSIDQAILSKQEPDEIARVVLDYAFQVIPCDRASVVILDEVTYQGTVLAVIQKEETAVSPGHTFPMSEIEKQNLESPETILPIRIVKNEQPRTNTGQQIFTEGIIARIKIPLIAQNKLIGFFNLGAQEESVLTDEHIAVAQEIATSLAITLQQSRLYQNERRQREQAEALRETGKALNSTLDFDGILNLLLAQINRAIPYDSAHIIRINGDVATIYDTHGYEQDEQDEQDTVAKASQPIFHISETPNLQWIIEHQDPLIIPDVHQYEGWQKEKSASQTRSWIGVPVFVNGVISILFALSHQQSNYYSEKHIHTLNAFASQVGLALENARLYEELRAYAEKLEARVNARTRALADANERLKELDRLKTKFISDVSHELRTPITNVNMYLDLFEQGRPEKRLHYMTILKQETRRLSQLIEEIFDESHYTNHLQQTDYVAVDMNKVIFQAIHRHQREATEKGLVLAYDLDEELPPVLGEPLQLAQVISNLLRNAINYTIAGDIHATTSQNSKFVVIRIDDSGSGISDEDLPHLFERFYRGKNASQSTIPGTGLGLGIVREIIELHGGQVQAENNTQGGASFKIMLPIAPVIMEPQASIGPSYRTPEQTSASIEVE